MILADVSEGPWYLNPQRMIALQTCYSLRQLFCQATDMSKFDMARQILANKNNLAEILPAPKSKSYESSFKKYHEIINYSTELLKPNENRSATGS